MSAAQRIAQAEQALQTGQPNLAMTYMRRASEHVAEDRAVNRRAHEKARQRIRSRKMSRSLGGWVEGFNEIVTETFKPFVDFINLVAVGSQSDYTLAGPSKGSS